MSFKIPCGGFRLDEESFSLDENGVLSVSVSWNDLTDKPFGELPTGGDTITWDGDTDGLVTTGSFFKVSDIVLDINDLSTVTIKNSLGQILTVEPVVMENNGIIGISEYAIFALRSNVVVGDGEVVPETGLYFLKATFGSVDLYLAELTIPGFTGFPTIKKIDEKYLPNTSGGGGTMRINVTYDENDELVSDKTYYEISGAIASGVIPYVVFYGMMFQLSSAGELSGVSTMIGEPEIEFSHLTVRGTINTTVERISIRNGDFVDFLQYTLTVTQ